ncbi:MFS transporter [Stenotrophomonas maltophilia]
MSSLDSSPATVRATSRTSVPVALLAVSAFVIVTTEFLIVGLLPALARDLGLGIARAGQLVTLFAFTVMLAGPPLTALLSHLDRRRLFVALLVLFAASNALAALALQPWLLALARILPALALPVFWGMASETAAQLAPAGQGGRAVARVYLGITAAMLFGIPLGTLAADAIGWRGSFWLLAALSLLMAAALACWMPDVAAAPRRGLGAQARVLRQPRLLGHVLLSVLVFTAMFAAYTYLADVLERLMQVPAAQVGWWLMGFGAVGLLGNVLGGAGSIVHRWARRWCSAWCWRWACWPASGWPGRDRCCSCRWRCGARRIPRCFRCARCGSCVPRRRRRRLPAPSMSRPPMPVSAWARCWAAWSSNAPAWRHWGWPPPSWPCWRSPSG